MKKIVLITVVAQICFSSLYAAEFETEDSKLKKAISFLIAEHNQFKKELQGLSEKLNAKSDCNCTTATVIAPIQSDKNITEEPKKKKHKKKDKTSKKNKKIVDDNTTIQEVSFATESKKAKKAE